NPRCPGRRAEFYRQPRYLRSEAHCAPRGHRRVHRVRSGPPGAGPPTRRICRRRRSRGQRQGHGFAHVAPLELNGKTSVARSVVDSETTVTATAPLAARSAQTLFDDVGKYLPAPDVEAVRRAYTFAAEAHAPQLRESGEPYINHPLAVAETLARLHMDTATIVAALCHDVSEDCNVPMAELESRFGREVARLVDGVTKLDKMQ